MGEIETKKWYTSKTVWLNVLALIGILSSSYLGVKLTAEETGAVLVLVNLILRIATKQAVTI